MTRDTAACERPRCSARDFRLTVCPEGFRDGKLLADLGRGIKCCAVVCHSEPNKDKPLACGVHASPETPSLVSPTKSVYYALCLTCSGRARRV